LNVNINVLWVKGMRLSLTGTGNIGNDARWWMSIGHTLRKEYDNLTKKLNWHMGSQQDTKPSCGWGITKANSSWS